MSLKHISDSLTRTQKLTDENIVVQRREQEAECQPILTLSNTATKSLLSMAATIIS